MHYFAIMILLQIICIVHVFRNRRNTAWIMAIAFLPMVGMIAYFLVEILPSLRRDPKMRKIQNDIAHKVDPERDIRSAREALAFVDTVANRIALGDALAARGDHHAALTEYCDAEAMAIGPDAVVIMRVAKTAMELGDAATAKAALDRLPETRSQSELDRRAYIAARVAEGQGDARQALNMYSGIVARVAGDDVRCRMAALYIQIGDKVAARQILKEVELRTRQMPASLLREEREMYAWAKRTLAEL